jgi:glutathione S-transferase
VCNFAIANGRQRIFAELVNEKDTPHLVAWIYRINERPACKLMFDRRPSEWANRRRV